MKSGDFVWMPVEVPGATYGVQEEEGIASVLKPMGVTWEVTDNTLDQADVITRMSDYLTANRGKIKAIIGLGDMVTGSNQARVRSGRRRARRDPGGRLGNPRDTTQEALGRLRQRRHVAGPAGHELHWPCPMAAMAGSGIPPGFDVITGALYEKDTAQLYEDIMSGK